MIVKRLHGTITIFTESPVDEFASDGACSEGIFSSAELLMVLQLAPADDHVLVTNQSDLDKLKFKRASITNPFICYLHTRQLQEYTGKLGTRCIGGSPSSPGLCLLSQKRKRQSLSPFYIVAKSWPALIRF